MTEPKVIRQTCTGCGRSLKIKIEQMPDDDFAIQCPKCGTEVGVRLESVRAALAAESAAPPPQPPPPPPAASAGVFGDERLPPLPHIGGDGYDDESGDAGRDAGRDAMEGVDIPAARDLTDQFLARGDRGVLPAAPRGEASVSAKRVAPRNAPRTTPPPRSGFQMAMPPAPILGGIAGGVLLLAVVLAFVFGGGGGGGGGDASASTDESIRAEVAALKATVGDPQGEAADLFVKGLDKFRGDSTAEHVEAHAFFRRSIAADPNHPEPLGALALSSIFLPKSERGIGVTQANKWADYVQREMPDSVHGGIARAALLSSLGRDAEAKELAAAQTQKHAGNALAWFVHGWVQRRSDPKSAAASFRKALEADPGFRMARTELAAAELAQGRIRAAQETLAQRKNDGPLGGDALAIEAAIAFRVGDDATGLDLLSAAADAEPKDAEIRLELAWRLLAAGDAGRALAHAEAVVKTLAPADDATGVQTAEAQLAMASALRLSGRAKEAVGPAQQGARAHPAKGFGNYHLGLALLAAGRADESADALREAASREPSRAAVHIALGQALARTSRYEDAIGALQTALSLDPGSARAHAELASLYAEAELTIKATEEWERMLSDARPLAPLVKRADPRWPLPPLDVNGSIEKVRRIEAADPNRDGRYRLYEGALLCEAGLIAEGLKRFASARVVLDPAPAAGLAGWQLVAGRPKDAVRLTQRAETARELAVRGWALKAARAAGAENAFAQALQLDPNEPYANLGQAQLLIARGRSKEALPLLAIARKALGDAPPVAKALAESGG